MSGIAIFGPNGSGKSTLAHALSRQLNYFEMDVEDYYFPEQKASRIHALESAEAGSTVEAELTDILPFSNSETKEEVQNAIADDIRIHPDFIIAGVTMNWPPEIMSCIHIAFWMQTPLEERLKRIQSREEKRFGARVLAGGDMFAQQAEFRNLVADRNPKTIEESAMKFTCPVILLDGTLSVSHNLEKVKDHISIVMK